MRVDVSCQCCHIDKTRENAKNKKRTRKKVLLILLFVGLWSCPIREPAAHRAVVGVEKEGGEHNATAEGSYSHGPYILHGAGNVGESVVTIENVHQRIVNDVERIGEFAKELIESGRLGWILVPALAGTCTGGHPDDGGEYHHGEQQYVETILPRLLGISHEGHGEQHEQQGGADEE